MGLNACGNKKGMEKSEGPDVLLLLPLTGAYAHIGQSLLKAAQMALFREGDERLNVAIVDTKGAFDTTVEALKKQPVPKVIVGPVFSSALDAASLWASQHKIPVISFSNNAGKATPGVFIMGIAPAEEIQQMVKFVTKRKMERFVAILPKGDYGAVVKDAITESIKAYGGSLVDVYYYGPNIEEVKAVVSDLKKKTVDAIFIPEGGRPLYEFSTAFAAEKISGKILGTSQWQPKDIHVWSQLNGAWYTQAYSDKKQVFAERYFELYKSYPESIAFMAYDAMAMVATLKKKSVQDDGLTIHNFLLPHGFQGFGGVFRLTQSGSVLRSLSILQVQNGSSSFIGRAD